MMTFTELRRAWPEYWATHNISDEELARIAESAGTVEEAQRIWENEDHWRDWPERMRWR